MMVNIIMFCLMGAVFANPISFNAVLESNELDSNSTESLSVLQSSQNGTSELLSSEERSSNQSQSSESSSESESTSTESTSEDKTEEESNSLLDEKDVADSMAETTDNSMGSEENIRKSWVQAFATVIRVQSAEDNSSTEVKGQSEQLTKKLANNSTTIRQGADTQLPLVETPADSSDTTSDSANTSEGATASTSDSSESSSSESNETSETSDSSDSRDTNASVEESNASDNALLGQLETKDCVNGTQSCESEEYLFQDIGDDAHYSVDSLMVPDDDERELSLRR